MTPTQKTALKDLAFWALGALMAVIVYLAQELRADVRRVERVNAVQDSTLGGIVTDLRYIKDGIDDLKRRP